MIPFLKALGQAPLSAKTGMVIIAFNVIVVVFAPVLAPHGETEILADAWAPGFWDSASVPGLWLGADHLGRDLLSRLIFGARNTIVIAALTTALSFTLGILGGFFAAIMRGWVDQALSRAVDIVMAFPSLILALLVISVMGSSIPVLIAVIAAIDATRVFRISRGLAMDIEAQDYVEAARLRGEGRMAIMVREILPNTVGPLIAEFGVRFCFVFLFIAALSFIGLGIQPPTADWGSMVRENSAAISFGILTPLFPAGAIALLTVGINLVIDWVVGNRAGRSESGGA